MGKMNGAFRLTLKMGQIIHQLPDDGDAPYQNLTPEQKAARAMKVAFKEHSGTTYTEAWYVENEKYL